jgi:hypothetical protein
VVRNKTAITKKLKPVDMCAAHLYPTPPVTIWSVSKTPTGRIVISVKCSPRNPANANGLTTKSNCPTSSLRVGKGSTGAGNREIKEETSMSKTSLIKHERN